MYKITIFILTLAIPFQTFSQIFKNKIYSQDIRTATIHNSTSILTYPIINLSNSDFLSIDFDDLNSDNFSRDYQYTIIHCNSDWQKSDLIFSQYCSGYDENYFDNVQQSFNTLMNYSHYNLKLPNNNISFKLSGNYIFYVYKNNDIYDSVLTLRFYVSENEISITAQIIRPQIVQNYLTHQQIQFTLTGQVLSFENINKVKVNVLQNNYDINASYNIKPTFTENHKLTFNDPNSLTFQAGNEFRFFDIQNIRLKSQKVTDIQLTDLYNFYILPEKTRTVYSFYKDINGKFIINNYLGSDSSVDADYVYVHFAFPDDNFIVDDDIYIFGDISNGNIDNNFKLQYNPDTKLYEKTLLLKQGFYNYSIISEKYKLKPIDGNFYDTKNNYLIFVYLTDILQNYDRLIGVKSILD